MRYSCIILWVFLNQSRCIYILSFVDKLVHFGEGGKLARSDGGKFQFLAFAVGERATEKEKNEAVKGGLNYLLI